MRNEHDPGRYTRRDVLLAGMGALALSAIGDLAIAQQPPQSLADTADQALDLLKQGNERYVTNAQTHKDYSVDRASRDLGQAPHAAILSCADSRVAPELLFDQGPGELFVVRVAGNFVTPDGLASLEYGAKVLGTKLIVVLGHTQCGAVNSTLKVLHDHTILPGHIQDLVRAMKPGIAPVLKEKAADEAHRAVVANVQYNVRRLMHSPPLLSEMVSGGDLKIVGGVYEIATGRVTFV